MREMKILKQTKDAKPKSYRQYMIYRMLPILEERVAESKWKGLDACKDETSDSVSTVDGEVII